MSPPLLRVCRIACISALASLAAGVAAATVGAVTPVDGGAAGGTTVPVNAGAGDQTDPHVSGDLVTYTDVNSGTVRYHDLRSGTDLAVPGSDVDTLSDISGSRIAFVRLQKNGDRTTDVYDITDGTLVTFDAGFDYEPFGPAIGRTTVAFEDLTTGNGDILVADASAPTAALVNLSNSPEAEGQPDVSPQGDLVVWEACQTPLPQACAIYRATRTGGAWGPPVPVLNTPLTTAHNADTDGKTIVYDGGPLPGGTTDIYLQPAAGGPATRLELPGSSDRNPSISEGVVGFESFDGAQTDIFVYVIATNTLYRITDTPTVNEVLNNVAALPNGDVHVVWAAEDEGVNVHNIYARTFTLPAADTTPPAITDTVTGTLGTNGWYTGDVGLAWQVAEPESPASLVESGCVDLTITADQPATSYSCSASSAGGAAGPVDVTIKRDSTPPAVSFSGNAGSYTVAQTVSIGCSATDNLSGIATACNGVNVPAYRFPLGASTISRSAIDNAGNVGHGSTSFSVVVDSRSLCALTSQFVQGSAQYQALGPAARRLADLSVAAACTYLTSISPKAHPAQKTAFINAYKAAVQTLARAGWLTQLQAATLATFADGL
jgi:hypothetical protein